MKKLLLPMFAFAFFILALLTFFYFLYRPSLSEESYQVKEARTQAQLDEIERDKTVSGWWAIYWPLVAAGAGVLVFATGGILVWNANEDRKSRRRLSELEAAARIATLSPDPNGNYPARITSDGLIQLSPGNLFQPTPQSLHYSPTLHFKGAESRELPLPTPLVTPEALPTPVQPISAQEAVGLLPRNKLMWCFGTDEKGKPATSSISDAVHVLNVGGTGQGKTTMTANLLYQIITLNDPSLYNLVIADLKNTLAEPFAPYSFMTATKPKDYINIVAIARDTVESRRKERVFDGPTWLIVVEEALALKRYLEPKQLAEYAACLDTVALVGREYRVFLLACAQVDYASKDFQNSRGQFMTRLAAAVLPSAARSMGFINTPLINQLWKERKPGQFLIESPDGDRLIQAPRLDVKGGELARLLPPPTQNYSGSQASQNPIFTSTKLPGGFPVTSNSFPFEAEEMTSNTFSGSKPQSIREIRILEMFKAGKDVATIVREIYQVEGGRAFQAKSAEVQEVLRNFISG